MPQFSEASKEKLSSCHPDLQILFNEVIKTFDCRVLEGYRNERDQNAAFDAKKSQLKFPHGKHNKLPSFAIDVSPCPIDWSKINRFYWFAGYVLGIAQMLKQEGKISHLIRYGGDWNRNFNIHDQSFNDLVHFELVQGDNN